MDILEVEAYQEILPFWQRFGVYADFDSLIKSIWLTGYVCITWEWGYNFWETLDIAFYRSGSYE